MRAAAKGGDNSDAAHHLGGRGAYCTEQEICDVLREVFGTYSDPAEF